jgi:hypothetical protein
MRSLLWSSLESRRFPREMSDFEVRRFSHDLPENTRRPIVLLSEQPRGLAQFLARLIHVPSSMIQRQHRPHGSDIRRRCDQPLATPAVCRGRVDVQWASLPEFIDIYP